MPLSSLPRGESARAGGSKGRGPGNNGAARPSTLCCPASTPCPLPSQPRSQAWSQPSVFPGFDSPDCGVANPRSVPPGVPLHDPSTSNPISSKLFSVGPKWRRAESSPYSIRTTPTTSLPEKELPPLLMHRTNPIALPYLAFGPMLVPSLSLSSLLLRNSHAGPPEICNGR